MVKRGRLWEKGQVNISVNRNIWQDLQTLKGDDKTYSDIISGFLTQTGEKKRRSL